MQTREDHEVSKLYRVAICEDEASVRKENARMCGDILDRLEVEHSLQLFSSSEELETVLISGGYLTLSASILFCPGNPA